MSDQSPSISRTGTTTGHSPITQDALDRLEANLATAFNVGLSSLKEMMLVRFAEHERRINELNNSHDKAIEAKRLTDEAATRIQERTVTTRDLQAWKDEVNKALATAAGAANANAKTWSLFMGIAVLIVNVLLRILLPAK